MIKQSLNSVIVKFRDLSVSHRSIDLQDTNISRCFAQPRLKHYQILQRETPISRLPFMKMVLFVVDKRCNGDMYLFYLFIFYLFKHIFHCLPQKHLGLSRGLTIIQ